MGFAQHKICIYLGLRPCSALPACGRPLCRQCSPWRLVTAQDWLPLGAHCLGWLLLVGRELFLSVCMGTYLSPLGSLLFEAAASLLVMRHCRSSCMHVSPQFTPTDSWNRAQCTHGGSGDHAMPCHAENILMHAGATQGWAEAGLRPSPDQSCWFP